MITDADLRDLIERARLAGATLRTRHDASGCIDAVSFGKLPGGEYRRIGLPGTEWVPPVQAAERLREIVAHT